MDNQINPFLESERLKIVERAIESKILKEEDYQKYANRYAEKGMNSFIQLLNMLLISKEKKEEFVFLTINKKMLKERKELERKFKCRIFTPEEVLKNKEMFEDNENKK